jgi:hypothetical protein
MVATPDTHDTAPPFITDPTPEYKHERPDSGVALSPEDAPEFHSAARESELHSSTIAPATSAGETPNFRLSLEDIVKGALRAPYSPERSIEESSDEEGVNDPFELERYRPYLETTLTTMSKTTRDNEHRMSKLDKDNGGRYTLLHCML